jgi:hypothetical protein
MHIMAAARYLEVGYRLRRANWEPEEYIYELAGMIEGIEISYSNIWDTQQEKIIEHRHIGSPGFFQFQMQDLLADDWEVITTGIRKDFNKSGNLEYQDEPDWDNYVCKGWGIDEEDEEDEEDE